MRNTLVAAFEAEEIEQEIAACVDTGGLDTLALKDQENDLVSMNDQINDTEEAFESLEKIRDIVSRSTEPLNQVSLEMMYAYTGSIYDKLGIAPRNYVKFAVENYSQSDNRKVAIESIGAALVALFRAIVEAIKRLIDQVVTFFKNFYDNWANTKAESQKNLSKLSSLPDFPKIDTLEQEFQASLDGLGMAVAKEDSSGSVNLYSAITGCMNVAGSMDVKKITKGVADYMLVMRACFQTVLLIETDIKKSPDIPNNANALIKAFDSINYLDLLADSYVKKAVPNADQGQGMQVPQKGLHRFSSNFLPGNKVFCVTGLDQSNKAKGIDALTLSSKTEVEIKSISVAASVVGKIKTLSKKEMDTLLNACIEIFEDTTAKREVLLNVSKVMRDCISAIEDNGRQIESMKLEDKLEYQKESGATDEQFVEIIRGIKAGLAATKNSSRILSSSVPRVMSYGLTLCKGINNYCRHSIMMY